MVSLFKDWWCLILLQYHNLTKVLCIVRHALVYPIRLQLHDLLWIKLSLTPYLISAMLFTFLLRQIVYLMGNFFSLPNIWSYIWNIPWIDCWALEYFQICLLFSLNWMIWAISTIYHKSINKKNRNCLTPVSWISQQYSNRSDEPDDLKDTEDGEYGKNNIREGLAHTPRTQWISEYLALLLEKCITK